MSNLYRVTTFLVMSVGCGLVMGAAYGFAIGGDLFWSSWMLGLGISLILGPFANILMNILAVLIASNKVRR